MSRQANSRGRRRERRLNALKRLEIQLDKETDTTKRKKIKDTIKRTKANM